MLIVNTCPKRSTMSFAALFACLMTAASAQAFTTIYNIPPDTAPTSIGSDTQLNLYDGGELDSSFVVGAVDGSSTNVELNIFGGDAGSFLKAYYGSTVNLSGGEIGAISYAYSGSTFNISGGEIGSLFEANDSTVVNITGGAVGSSFDALSGSVVNLHGGRIDSSFTAESGSNILIDGGYLGSYSSFEAGSSVAIYGGNFKIDNVPVAGLDTPGDTVSLNVPEGALLTGILSDGSVAIFDGNFADGTLTLHATTFPSGTQGIFNVPSDPVPAGLRQGQVLNLGDGGVIDKGFDAMDATLNINGGALSRSRILNSAVTLDAGQVSARMYMGSNVNMSGGYISSPFYEGSSLDLHGGVVDDDFIVRDGASVSIHGSDFRLNGTPITSLQNIGDSLPVNISDGSVLTGVLEDGSVFLFSNLNDRIADGSLTLIVSTIPATTQMVYNLPGDTPPVGLRSGQTLILGPEGEPTTSNFAAYNATILINGGFLGHEPEVYNSVVTMTDGYIGWGFDAHGSSVVNIQGGTVSQYFDAAAGSTINITGGRIDRNFDANPGSTINYMGGTIHNSFGASADSVVNIYGTSFIIDGVDITSTLVPGVPFTIDTRDVSFIATMMDGGSFSFYLRSTDWFNASYCDPDATLTIMIPIPGDLNADGFVGLDDLDKILANWNTTVAPGNVLAGDTNNDGYIGLDDLDLILNHWNTGSPPTLSELNIPEPTTSVLALIAFAFISNRHRI